MKKCERCPGWEECKARDGDYCKAGKKAKNCAVFEGKLDKNDLLNVNFNKNGDAYFIFEVKASRAINPKAKRKADELLIVGVPKKHINDYCKELGIVIADVKTNKPIYGLGV